MTVYDCKKCGNKIDVDGCVKGNEFFTLVKCGKCGNVSEVDLRALPSVNQIKLSEAAERMSEPAVALQPASLPVGKDLNREIQKEMTEVFREAFREAKLRSGKRRFLENIFFNLSLPVLIPSLIVSRIMTLSGRWGRIPLAWIFLDGFLLCFFLMGYPVLLLLAFLAWVSSFVLLVLRYSRIQYGIFLGYSNAVAYRLILGGVALAAGIFVLVPWSIYTRKIAPILTEVSETSAEAITDWRVKEYVYVTLPDAVIDWENMAYKFNTPDGVSLLSGGYADGDEPEETWVPVQSTQYGVWLVFPRAAAGAGKKAVEGIYKGVVPGEMNLIHYIKEKFNPQGMIRDPHYIIAMNPKEYLRYNGIWDEFKKGFDWLKGMGLIGVGIALVFWGSVIARTE